MYVCRHVVARSTFINNAMFLINICCKLLTNQYQNQQVSFCPMNMRNKIIIEYGVICVSLRLFRSYTKLTKRLYTVRVPYLYMTMGHVAHPNTSIVCMWKIIL